MPQRQSHLRLPVETVLVERLAQVPDLHLGMDAVLIDDGAYASDPGKNRLDVLPPTVEVMLTNYEPK